MLEAIRYSKGNLQLLDQLQLPHKQEYIQIKNHEDAWHAIHSMKVRGAPAIAIAAALSLAVEAEAETSGGDAAAGLEWVRVRLARLRTARPTAVNLFEAAARLEGEAHRAAAATDPAADAAAVRSAVARAAERMLAADVADNRAIGRHGAEAVLARLPRGAAELRVLTHCNTGALATAGYGTALGVVRALHERALAGAAPPLHCFACETRPYLQGARLTAFELLHERIPATLITDSMAAFLMAQPAAPLAAVLVGADRVAANGDTANKIGTYALALAAAAHGVPLFVCAPLTSVDCGLAAGAAIPIEQRPAHELTSLAGTRLAPDGIAVWNPSFDVTPHRLIAGIVTEHGLVPRRADGNGFDLPAFVSAHRAAAPPSS